MLYELIDMTTWKTKKEILKELQDKDIILDEREFRRRVKESNKLYYEHEIDILIAHSNKGYKATKDRDEALKTANDLDKRAFNMLHDSARIKKANGENCNMKLEITENSFVVTEDRL